MPVIWGTPWEQAVHSGEHLTEVARGALLAALEQRAGKAAQQLVFYSDQKDK